MGTGVNTYLTAGEAILVGAVGAAVTGLDMKAVGMIVFVVGTVGLVLTLARSTPRRPRPVTETSGTRTSDAVAGQPTVPIDYVSGGPVLH